MKKLALIIGLVLVISIIGCSGQSDDVAPIAVDVPTNVSDSSDQVDLTEAVDTAAGTKLSPEEIQAANAEFETEQDRVVDIVNSLNAKKCESVESKNLKIRCIEQVNYGLALKNGDISYCKNILDEQLAFDCEIDAKTGVDVEE